MKINISNIPNKKTQDEIKQFLSQEIKAGKLTGWDIAEIEMKSPRGKEYPGIIFLKDSSAYPYLFSIFERDSESDKYLLSIAIQMNK
jgi:hypothetical protein